MTKSALVIAAHPDDEVLGCGATLAKLSSEGWLVNVLILVEGSTSRSAVRDVDLHHNNLNNLIICAEKAQTILGTHTLTFHSLPDNRLDSLDLLDVVKLIETAIDKFQPSLVLTHHVGDVNIDHRIIHDAVIAACRPQPGHPVKTLLFFEVPSSTEWRPPASATFFAPNYFFDVSAFLSSKLNALNAYTSELKDFPHPRSLEAVEYLARWRGATIGCTAAEAFMLGRMII